MSGRLLILLIAAVCGVVTILAESTKSPSNVTTAPPNAEKRKVCEICNCTENYVNCSSRGLKENLADAIWPNVTIKLLDFRYNDIKHVRRFPNSTIEKIDLSFNRIENMDHASFKNLKNFTELNLGYNRLDFETLLPHFFAGGYRDAPYEPLEALRVLNLERNLLHSLNSDLFTHIRKLVELNLAGNQLEALGHPTILAINELSYLKTLNLSSCRLSSIDKNVFHTLKNLTTLDLSDNKFTILPPVLEDVKSLDNLIMSRNPIVWINGSNSFPSIPLTSLIMSGMNELLYIGKPGLSNLKTLEILEIENCPKLSVIHEDALKNTETNTSTWPAITHLRLANNNLHYIHSGFLIHWERLKELRLQNNTWRCDCKNEALIKIVLPDVGKRLLGKDYDELRCSWPNEHKNRTLHSLENWHLRCPDAYGAHPENDAAVFIGVFIGLLLGLPISVAMFLLWRKGYLFCYGTGPATFSRAFYKRAPPYEYDM